VALNGFALKVGTNLAQNMHFSAAMLNYACEAGEAGKGGRRQYSCHYGRWGGEDDKSS